MATSSSEKTHIIIVSKSGSLSECIVETHKETTLDELINILSKKCGNKKSDGFNCYHTYKYKNSKGKGNAAGGAGAPMLYIDVWCKTDGRAGQENKYELPPPIDEIILFGNMALVARADKQTACDLSIELWNKIYEKLFGGFEDLSSTAQDDENEIDELAFVPASKKTTNGYLKDGFVVDDSLGSGSAGSSDVDIGGRSGGGAGASKKKGGKKKSKTQKSDTTTESEFVTETETETETETDSVSDSEIRSDSSNDCACAGETASATATATATATTNRKITPSIKKTPVAKKPSKATKKDELAAIAAAAAVAAILGDSSDSELSEDSYSS